LNLFQELFTRALVRQLRSVADRIDLLDDSTFPKCEEWLIALKDVTVCASLELKNAGLPAE
jgi:hypothetical protein